MTATSDGGGAPAAAPRLRVLVAEDEPVVRLILVRTLEQLGHEVIEADSGTRALELLASAAPEVVITDWEMPGADGLAICRRVRAEPRGRYVYVLMVTGRRGSKDAVAALEAGADEFLTKPVDRDELQARLRTAGRVLGLEAELAARAEAAEEALRLLAGQQREIVEAERRAAVGALGVAVKHEVNNPLTGVLGLVDFMLLDQAKLPKETVDALGKVRDLARRIAAIVAKLDSARVAPTKEYLRGTQMLDLDGKPGL